MGKKFKDNLLFIKTFLSKPHKVGSIIPSSLGLSQKIIKDLEFGNGKTVLEIGPGTGAVTQFIFEKMDDISKYIGIELNMTFVETLKKKFPKANFIHESAENLKSCLSSLDKSKVELIICTLPWTLIPKKNRDNILTMIREAMDKESELITFLYLHALLLPGGLSFQKNLKRNFTNVYSKKIVWNNFPPALIFKCKL